MVKIIPFRTREEWEKEKTAKIMKDWLNFLEFEKNYATYQTKEKPLENDILKWLQENDMI
ncbi:hypothetical protein WMZ97_16740 [Lentibacillus sp. N15]|uniref:hypothetical protein n=1 Tax=Lentibacillus songyuanensis TaxID=3136161 RepID=UPI0031B9B3C4